MPKEKYKLTQGAVLSPTNRTHCKGWQPSAPGLSPERHAVPSEMVSVQLPITQSIALRSKSFNRLCPRECMYTHRQPVCEGRTSRQPQTQSWLWLSWHNHPNLSNVVEVYRSQANKTRLLPYSSFKFLVMAFLYDTAANRSTVFVILMGPLGIPNALNK